MNVISVIRRLFKWLLLSFAGLLVLVFAAIAIAYVNYSMWRTDRLEALEAGSQLADTEMGQIEYVLKGERGPIMLYVHSTPGGYDASPAAGRNFRVLAPSRPGYLSTSLEIGRTPIEQARSYAALLDALNEREPVLVMAASGGGPSGIAFSALYPERTAGLLAIEAVSQSKPAGGGLPPFMQNDFAIWAVFSAVEKLQGPAGIVSMVVPDPENQKLILNDPEKVDTFIPLIWSLWPVSRRNAGWQNDIQQFEQLSLPAEDIHVPTLIIQGTDDVNVPIAQSMELARQIADSEIYIVDGADHMMPLTHQEEVEKVVDEFLQNHGLADFIE
jgi:pimeloyl-ACP methyl ester carboxylesterase